MRSISEPVEDHANEIASYNKRLLSLAEAVIRSIDISKFALRIHLSAASPSDKHMIGIDMQAAMHVADRDKHLTAEPVYTMVQVRRLLHFSAAEMRDACGGRLVDHIQEEFLSFIRGIVLHELDECTYVDKQRIFDPHDDSRRRDDVSF